MEIRDNDGKLLKEVEGDTLVGADLVGAQLIGANLIRADLRGANLFNAELRVAHLRSANLTRANLTDAELRGADLYAADLIDANLTGALLAGTDMRGAILTRTTLDTADLRGAYLTDANLTGANLKGANMSGVSLAGVDMAQTMLGWTVFDFCDDLHEAIGLEEVVHYGPSALDAHTLRASVCKLPRVFLEGVGYSREEIENLQAMYKDAALRYYSCFLSSASEDSEFADRLHSDLLAANVSCWHYRADMRGGLDWRDQINEAVALKDKLVLISSLHSTYKKPVVDEILRAIDLERKHNIKKLFPIRLDDHILGDRMMDEAHDKVKSGEWRENWVFYVREKHIPDFGKWKDHDAFQEKLKDLLRDMKTPPKPPA